MKNLVTSLKRHPFQLTMGGVFQIFSHVLSALPGHKGLDDGTAELLNGVNYLIQVSLSTIDYFKNKTHLVRDNFGLHLCLLSEDDKFHELGKESVRILVANVPGFANWKDYVTCDEASKAKIDHYLSPFVSSTEKAVELPSEKLVQQRHFVLQSQDLAKHAKHGVFPSIQVFDPTVAARKKPVPRPITSSTFDPKISPDDAFKQAMESVFKQLDQHSEERQREILDDAEFLAINAVARTLREMADANQPFVSWENPLIEPQKKLAELHKKKRERKQERLTAKFQATEKLMAGSESTVVKNFQKLKKDQESAISWIGDIYAIVEEIIPVLDVSNELVFLNQNLSDVIEVSVSIVVSGLVSVGKSTVVNCLIGQDLSPHRTSAMTAIPTRYVHRAHQETPSMLVPFHAQLNKVIRMIRKTITEKGMDTALDNLPGADRKATLKMICENDKFEIKSLYDGAHNITNATENINDLYRLAAHEFFGDDVFEELPQDWSRGLDHYLTVYLKFPGIDPTLSLLEFCIVDTPGIDEANAAKLSLKKVLTDALEISNYVALVTDVTGIHGEGITPLLQLIDQAKSSTGIPRMALITRCDQVNKRDLDNIKQDCHRILAVNRESPIFDQKAIFPISALEKSIAQRMANFIDSENRKPRLQGEGVTGQEKLLAEAWVYSIEDGIDEEEKLENYEDRTIEGLSKRCKRMEENSMMKAPIDKIILDLSERAIPICIQTAIRRIREKIEILVGKLRTKPQAVQATKALEEGRKLQEELLQHQDTLRKALEEEAEKIGQQIDQQVETEISKMQARDSLPIEDPPRRDMSTLLGFLQYQFKSMDNDLAKKILVETEFVSFPSDQRLMTSLQEIQSKIAAAWEEFLIQSNRNISFRLSTAAGDAGSEVVRVARKLEELFKTNFKISFSDNLTELNLKRDKGKVRRAITISSEIKKPVKKSNALKQIIPSFMQSRSASEKVKVDPNAVRRTVIMSAIKEFGNQWSEIVKKQVDDIVLEYLKSFDDSLSAPLEESFKQAQLDAIQQEGGAEVLEAKNKFADRLAKALADESVKPLINLQANS